MHLAINIHHNDFPIHVSITEAVLKTIVSVILDGQLIDQQLIKQIHSAIFAGTEFLEKGIKVGAWREVDVQVGNHFPPPHYKVPELMNSLTTINVQEIEPEHVLDIVTRWYIHFNSIHPFQDGNGRVSWSHRAAIYKVVKGEYLCPLQ